MNLAEFIIKVESFNANIDISLVRRAYEFCDRAHAGQKRESGDPFIEHCLEVAFVLAELHMDSATIAAGLLHDVLEDTPVTKEQIKQQFGEEIAELVDGVTKLGEFKFQSVEEEQVEYFRKLLLSMAKDIRVIVIKLADRLHNMRTLEHLPKDRIARIAAETKDVYAPLAHRFGIGKIKWELEDWAFKYQNPEAYRELSEKVQARREEREAYIQSVIAPLSAQLEKAGIKAEIKGRAKHFDSIFRKMGVRKKPFEEIFDLFAIRAIVETVRDCYHVLGLVHQLWTPIRESFDDYIALPKSNGYQSLHTTVIGPANRPVEIQIRTFEMHRLAEFGIAAHWLYKEGKKEADEGDKHVAWLREIIEWQKDMATPSEFLEYLKLDLYADEVFVFTPKGELRELPKGATPLDFAYAIHTDVGNRCTGARINGMMRPLSTPLKSGDEVEIITSPHQTPSQDWLKIVQTSRARSKIRHYLKMKGYEQAVALGKEMLEREAKKHRLKPTDAEILDLAMSFSYTTAEGLYAALGDGTLSLLTVIHKLVPEQKPEADLSLFRKIVEKAKGEPKGISIGASFSGGDLMYRLGRCCQPIPGEPIVGFITRGRGISIHRRDCPNAVGLLSDGDRTLKVDWNVEGAQSFVVRLKLIVEERKNILRDVADAVAKADSNVRSVGMESIGRAAPGHLVVEVKNIAHLARVIKELKKVKGVVDVERVSEPEGEG
ncbi:MAG: RelA/SpoT family protein [Candidatus Zixiibacteriota bacterium]